MAPEIRSIGLSVVQNTASGLANTKTANNAATAAKPAQAASTASGKKALTPTELQEAVNSAQEAISSITSDIRFNVDQETGTVVVKIIDRESEEVLRQMPSEDFLRVARALEKSLSGQHESSSLPPGTLLNSHA